MEQRVNQILLECKSSLKIQACYIVLEYQMFDATCKWPGNCTPKLDSFCSIHPPFFWTEPQSILGVSTFKCLFISKVFPKIKHGAKS